MSNYRVPRGVMILDMDFILLACHWFWNVRFRVFLEYYYIYIYILQ